MINAIVNSIVANSKVTGMLVDDVIKLMKSNKLLTTGMLILGISDIVLLSAARSQSKKIDILQMEIDELQESKGE